MKLERFELKLLLAFLMVLDHIDFFISEELNIAFNMISRCVAVGFAYLAVEGFLYTKDIKKYLIRLYAFAIFMLIGNHIINKLLAPYVYVNNSIIMTLALGVTMLLLYTKISSILLKIISVASIIYISKYFEGGIIILPFMLMTYKFRDDEFKRNISYFIISFILLLSSISYGIYLNDITYALLKIPHFLMISIIPLLKLYNGKIGIHSNFSKYFFYIFYPSHLWIIAILTYLIKSNM